MDGVMATNMIRGQRYSHRELSATFKQARRVIFLGWHWLRWNDLVDCEESQSYTTNRTIQFP